MRADLRKARPTASTNLSLVFVDFGIEPPKRGFSVRRNRVQPLNIQSLATLATPHSGHYGYPLTSVLLEARLYRRFWSKDIHEE